MAIPARLHAVCARLVRPGGWRRFIALPMAALLGGVAFGTVASKAAGPSTAARICGDRDVLLEQFRLQHDERPQALGLGADGGVIEILVSPQGGWTMLVTYPQRPTCVVAIGKAWETLQLAGNSA